MFSGSQTKEHIFISASYNNLLFSNGLIGSGLYTAVNCIWEKMKVDQEVDIFHAIKHLRYHRKNIVEDLVSQCFKCFFFQLIVLYSF